MGGALDHAQVTDAIRRWVESVVVGLNLCPFAKPQLVNHRIRFVVSDAGSEDQLLADLASELELLSRDATVETTLLIHPAVLADFYEYNEFLDRADGLLKKMGLEGIYQVASFHPQYQFAGTHSDDVENYTNRAPYPMLHILREDSLERAIDSHPDVDQIPLRNISLMKDLGEKQLQTLLQACFE